MTVPNINGQYKLENMFTISSMRLEYQKQYLVLHLIDAIESSTTLYFQMITELHIADSQEKPTLKLL